jgi:hypothetical protein
MGAWFTLVFNGDECSLSIGFIPLECVEFPLVRATIAEAFQEL